MMYMFMQSDIDGCEISTRTPEEEPRDEALAPGGARDAGTSAA